MLTLLFLGDVVGEPGRSAVVARLPELKRDWSLDFIIVNGENAAAGRGITPKITIDLLSAGVSVITTGDHIWDRKEIVPFIETEPRLLRPLNYPSGAPGGGTIDTASRLKTSSCPPQTRFAAASKPEFAISRRSGATTRRPVT